MRKTWVVTTLLGLFTAVLIATAQDAGPSTDPSAGASAVESAQAPDGKGARRRAGKAKGHRYQGVPFITASPIASRRGASKVSPSTTVIEYDNNAAVTRSPNTSGVLVGNRFDVGGGGNPIAGPWTVTGFVVQNAGSGYPTSAPAATVAFHAGPGAGTAAPALAVLTGIPLNGAIQSFLLGTPLTGSGSFLGGVVNSAYPFFCAVTSVPPAVPCNGVALDTAQNASNPLGFHAMQVKASAAGLGFANLGNLNAIFKVTGSNLPIELMSFRVDSE